MTAMLEEDADREAEENNTGISSPRVLVISSSASSRSVQGMGSRNRNVLYALRFNGQ